VATVVQMPKLGNTVEECLLTAWLKHKGDAVLAGDIVAEVETDKASFEVTAPADGVVLDTFFDEGALVPVFTAICAVGAPGEDVEGLRPSGRVTAAPQPARHPGPAGPAEASGPAGPVGHPSPAGSVGHPGPARPAEASGPARPAAPAAPAGLAGAGTPSPRARRFAREHGLQPQAAAGSGPGGRVLEADLRGLFYSQPMASAAARGQLARGYLPGGAGSGLGGMIRLRDLDEPAARVSSVRQRIAARVRESLSTTAQYTLNGSADAGGLLAVRRRMKADPATAAITIGDLVAFCAIRTLRLAPDLNAEFTDGILRRHAEIHLGFACDTDRGLLVPVVRSSQRLSLPGLSRRIRELAAQAADGTIAADDLTGGTFTVSNLGSLGVESFTPVLNPPQVAILGVDAIEPKPARKPDGNIEFIDAIGLSLTLDHQVIDGAPGARFLDLLKHQIENVEALCTTTT
jgi:pyruvate dehydrogenase E2 component (dihydrolipoamide acetyltransferase)